MTDLNTELSQMPCTHCGQKGSLRVSENEVVALCTVCEYLFDLDVLRDPKTGRVASVILTKL